MLNIPLGFTLTKISVKTQGDAWLNTRGAIYRAERPRFEHRSDHKLLSVHFTSYCNIVSVSFLILSISSSHRTLTHGE